MFMIFYFFISFHPAPLLWSQLPVQVQEAESLSTFKIGFPETFLIESL